MSKDKTQENTINNGSGTFRVKKINFTQVSNSALRNNDLSLKAKGLYSLIQSFITIPDFILNKNYLMSICKEKEHSFDTAWKELKDKGYLKQYRIPKGERGLFVYEYDLLDEADTTTPSLLNISNLISETSQISPIDHTPNFQGYGLNDHTPNFPPYGLSTPWIVHPVDNGGYINNTDINNTDINNTTLSNIDCHSHSHSHSQTGNTKDQKKDKTMTSDMDIPQHQLLKSAEIKKESPNINNTNNKNVGDKYNTYLSILHENIDYRDLLIAHPNDKSLIDELVNCTLDVILTEGNTVKINGEEKSRQMVIGQYMQLSYGDIEHVIHKFKQQDHKITHINQYIKTMLYTCKQEQTHYYNNEIQTNYGK